MHAADDNKQRSILIVGKTCFLEEFTAVVMNDSSNHKGYSTNLVTMFALEVGCLGWAGLRVGSDVQVARNVLHERFGLMPFEKPCRNAPNLLIVFDFCQLKSGFVSISWFWLCRKE